MNVMSFTWFFLSKIKALKFSQLKSERPAHDRPKYCHATLLVYAPYVGIYGSRHYEINLYDLQKYLLLLMGSSNTWIVLSSSNSFLDNIIPNRLIYRMSKGSLLWKLKYKFYVALTLIWLYGGKRVLGKKG